MRVKELLELKKRIFEKCCELTVKKGHDYSGVEDTLSNLKVVELLGVSSAERGVLIRLLDKIMRLKNFIDTGVLQVNEESIQDTVVDAHNYLDLLLALILEKKMRNDGEA